MECLGRDVNRMVCGVGMGSGVRLGWDGVMGDGGDVNLVLGDCVWCVLLPEFVANATASSRTTPRG